MQQQAKSVIGCFVEQKAAEGDQLFEHLEAENSHSITDLQFRKKRLKTIGSVESFPNPNLTSLLCRIQSLDVSSNSISSLKGIEVFKGLEQLNVANNKIKSGMETIYISSLKYLRVFYVKGNDFLSQPLDSEFIELMKKLNNDIGVFELYHNSLQNADQEESPCTDKFSEVNKNRTIPKNSNSQHFVTEKKQALEVKNFNVSNINKVDLVNKTTNQKMIKRFSDITPLSTQRNQQVMKHDNHVPLESPKFGLSAKFDFLPHEVVFNGQKDKKNSEYNKSSPLNMSQSFKVFQSTPYKESLKSSIEGISKRQQIDNVREESEILEVEVQNLKFNIVTDSPEMKNSRKRVTQRQFDESYELCVDFLEACNYPNGEGKADNRLSIRKVIEKGKEPHSNFLVSEYSKNTIPIVRKNSLYESVRRTSVHRPSSPIYQQQQQTANHDIKGDKKNESVQTQNNLQSDFSHPSPIESLVKGILSMETKNLKSSNQNVIDNRKSLSSQQCQSFGSSITQKDVNNMESFVEQQTEQSVEEYQKFYYGSLAQINPTFNLLYSPLGSLSESEKDLLLEELFRNHKEIFMILVKWHKSQESQQTKIQQQTRKIHLLNQKLSDCHHLIRGFESDIFDLRQQISDVEAQKQKKEKEVQQMNDLLKCREKLIADTQIQYKRVQKENVNLKAKLQNLNSEDDKEEHIMAMREKSLQKKYLTKMIQGAQRSLKRKSSMIDFSEKLSKIRKNKTSELLRSALEECIIESQQNKKQQIIQNKKWNQNAKQLLKRLKTILRHKIANPQTLQKLLYKYRVSEVLHTLKQHKVKKDHNQYFKALNRQKLSKKYFEMLKKNRNQSKTCSKKCEQLLTEYSRRKFKKQIFYLLITAKNIRSLQISTHCINTKRQIDNREIKLFFKLFRNQHKNFKMKEGKIYRFFQKKRLQSTFSAFRQFINCQKKNQLNNARRNSVKKIDLQKFLLRKSFEKFKYSVNILPKRTYRKIKICFETMSQRLRLKMLDTKHSILRTQKVLDFSRQTVKKQQFLYELRKNHTHQINLRQKQTLLESFIYYQRISRSKLQFLYSLHFNKSIRHHERQIKQIRHQFRSEKEKQQLLLQSHEQQVTALKLSVEVQDSEIEYNKKQLNLLFSREQMILEQKEKYQLDLNERQQEVSLMKEIIIEHEKRSVDLGNKCEEIMALYEAALQEIQLLQELSQNLNQLNGEKRARNSQQVKEVSAMNQTPGKLAIPRLKLFVDQNGQLSPQQQRLYFTEGFCSENNGRSLGKVVRESSMVSKSSHSKTPRTLRKQIRNKIGVFTVEQEEP